MIVIAAWPFSTRFIALSHGSSSASSFAYESTVRKSSIE